MMDLQWSPKRPDHLITWSQDITLYQVEDCESDSGKLKKGCLSENKAVTYMAKITDMPYSKVIDLYSGPESEWLIAVGLVNGKVILTSFGASAKTAEIVPKHTRQVYALEWGKSAANLLAAGYEKARQDYAVAIWDVSQYSKGGNGFGIDSIKPLIELGSNETAHSIAWVQPKSILVGMNGKHIKLFDLRDSQPKLGNNASTKAVYGISVDTLCNHRVVSYADNQAFVWDTRNFEKPIVVLDHAKPLSKIGWCPTRSGLLACLEKDSSSIILHDVHHAALSAGEDGEPAVLERRLSPAYSTDVIYDNNLTSSNTTSLASFAWHYADENMITTCTSTGVLWNSVVFERITFNWSSTSKLGWSNGKRSIQYIDNTDEIYASLDDISVKMQQRAINGYGLLANLKDNGSVVEECDTLKNLWVWLDYCKTLTETEKYRVPCLGTVKFPGASVALNIDSAPGSTTTSTVLKSEVSHNNFGNAFDLKHNKIYRSEERTFVQQLCGWNPGILDYQGSATRRAAIALFHLKMRDAIKILNDSNNSIIAMAIAGFTEEKTALWRELAQSTSSHLTDPYIRAIFAFLTESDSNYETILNEKELLVADRVGFACSFLGDTKLISYNIQELSNELIQQGNFDGILLTGMTTQAFPLLQKYIDNTADVQTVALLIIRTMATEISSSSLLKLWTERYREILDSWKLWEQRAEFDIMKNTNNPSLVPQSEVAISCNFCAKSISTSGLSTIARQAQLFSRFSSSNPKFKASCCPSCRKPLPHCSICLMHMGTILGSSKEIQQAVTMPVLMTSLPSSEAISWYTWCQTCKHGGHTVHLQHWFQNQPECPVSGCSCKCISLDRVVDFPS